MDLIYTDSQRADMGVLSAYAFDLSYGAEENNFEMAIGKAEAVLESKAYIYIDGTEYGGIVDGIKTVTHDSNITYTGRTWHGIINSKVIEPNPGENYLVVSGDANDILAMLVDRLGLSALFVADENSSGVSISRYQFHRYCKGYDGIRAMLAANGAKLKISWQNRAVQLSAVPVVDYTKAPVDGDIATLSIEQNHTKVNHLVCLGRGELSEREVIHLYSDADGNIGDVQYFTGINEVADVYENSNTEDLRSDGVKRFQELRDNDKAEMDLPESDRPMYDIGDIVGATDIETGVSVASAVTQKIVRINNGAISTEYKTGS